LTDWLSRRTTMGETLSAKERAWIRRWRIITAAGKSGHLSFEEIAREFGKGEVSDQAIRDDISAIASMPRLVKDSRTGGLVNRVSDKFDDTYYSDSLEEKPTEKEAIAAALIRKEGALTDPADGQALVTLRGSSVVVGPGTTTLAVLKELANYPSVEALTCNYGAMVTPGLVTEHIHWSGGTVSRSIACFVGAASVRTIANFGAETTILGVSGLCYDEYEGALMLYCHEEIQIPVKQALLEHRRKIIVVTTEDKIDKRDAWSFGSVNSILAHSRFYVVTDPMSQQKVEKLQQWLKDASAGNPNNAAHIVVDTGKSDVTA